ncbi:MAG: redox-regulated ATPase YchF [Anaerolineae bacterium]
MDIGIIGLPTSGKTTIFNALTGGELPTMAASMGRLELHRATVNVPDERLEALSALYKPRKTTHAQVTYIDIAGLETDIDKGGLSGQLRNQIATMDAFVHVVRAFESTQVPHPLGHVDPQRDLEVFNGELILADLITVENRLSTIAERLQKGARGKERQALEEEHALFVRLRNTLETEQPLRDLELSEAERELLGGFGLLTLKPMLILLNTGEDLIPPEELVVADHRRTSVVSLCGQLEMEMSRLPPAEAEFFREEFGIEELARRRLIRESYALLGLISFFTVSKAEVRAWTLKKGSTALDAAATVHTDMARGFVRAEIVTWDALLEAGNLNAARQSGTLHVEGKEYVVKDGDVIHIRFSI